MALSLQFNRKCACILPKLYKWVKYILFSYALFILADPHTWESNWLYLSYIRFTLWQHTEPYCISTTKWCLCFRDPRDMDLLRDSELNSGSTSESHGLGEMRKSEGKRREKRKMNQKNGNQKKKFRSKNSNFPGKHKPMIYRIPIFDDELSWGCFHRFNQVK